MWKQPHCPVNGFGPAAGVVKNQLLKQAVNKYPGFCTPGQPVKNEGIVSGLCICTTGSTTPV